MDATLFVKITEEVGKAENTEAPGYTKRIIVQQVALDIIGDEEYRRYGPMIGIAIDYIVDNSKKEKRYIRHIRELDKTAVITTHISRRRSFLAYLCCLGKSFHP